MRASWRWSALFSLSMCLCTIPTTASEPEASGPIDRQIAQSLFDDARRLLEAGKVVEACPKFAESQRLDPGGGTLLNLALCLELEGRLASSWARYQEALSLAIRDGRADRETFAREHLQAITPKLTRVVVSVPLESVATALDVSLDGSRLPPEAWGTPIPVDPGRHRVTATGERLAPWEATFDVVERGKTIHIEVAPSREAAPPESLESRRSMPFWALMGTGAAAVVTGAVLGGMALGADHDAKDGCDETRAFCSEGARSDASRANTLAWLSTGLMAAGVVLGGVAFLLPREPQSPQPLSPTKVSAGVGTLQLTHAF